MYIQTVILNNSLTGDGDFYYVLVKQNIQQKIVMLCNSKNHGTPTYCNKNNVFYNHVFAIIIHK